MHIFDCTLRDGANVVGCGFNAELTEMIIDNLVDCGITTIELGNAYGLGSYEAKPAIAPLDDAGYLEIVRRKASKAELGMFLLCQNATPERITRAKEAGLSFLRVGADASKSANAISAVKMVKDAGLKCFYSAMKCYVLPADDLAEEAAALEKVGLDVFTIMDSAGTMLPNEVTEYISALKKAVKISVGFHGHNNLGLSVGNAIAALVAGADYLDTGLMGMARSAGNCPTELLVGALARKGIDSGCDFYKLCSFIDNKLAPAMKEYNYASAVTPKDLVLGYAGCHSAFSNLYKKVAEETNSPLYELIVETSKLEKRAPTEELMRTVAKQLERRS